MQSLNQPLLLMAYNPQWLSTTLIVIVETEKIQNVQARQKEGSRQI